MQNEKEKKTLLGFSFCRLFSAWKIVGMTMTYTRFDVMNIIWRKTEMEQKSDRERWRDGSGGGGFCVWILFRTITVILFKIFVI